MAGHVPDLPEIYGVGRSERAVYDFFCLIGFMRSRARPLPQGSGRKNTSGRYPVKKRGPIPPVSGTKPLYLARFIPETAKSPNSEARVTTPSP